MACISVRLSDRSKVKLYILHIYVRGFSGTNFGILLIFNSSPHPQAIPRFEEAGEKKVVEKLEKNLIKINLIKNCTQQSLIPQPLDHYSNALPTELSHYLVVGCLCESLNPL